MLGFEYRAPTSLDEALRLLHDLGDEAKLISGGTGLINFMKQNLVQPAYLIGLRRVRGLDGITLNNGDLHLGALCTQRAVETSPLVREHIPLLAETYRHVATVRIRNMATVGGGLAHGDPNQDPPPTLLALEARVRLASTRGAREVPVIEFFRDYFETATQPDEIVTELIVPHPPASGRSAFIKFVPRSADDYATVSVAAHLDLDANGACREVRIGLGAVGSTALRARGAEGALRGQRPTPALLREAAAVAKTEVDPISDPRGSAAYKREMVEVMVRRALEQALAGGGAGA